MKNERKYSQNGAISVFTMIAMVFFLLTIMGVYLITSKRAQTQTESMGMIQEQYYAKEGEENQKYSQKIASSDEIIPIYTKEQLWSIGKQVAIEIEGKVYDFSNADASKYELKNDLVINIDQLEASQVILEPNITKQNHEIYYYYEGDYYELSSDGTSDLTINGKNFKYKNLSKSLGYVTDGLMVHYDGIKNTATGHDASATIWKDLSGNGKNGTLKGGNWEKNSLNLDGVDDSVAITQMNYERVTVETVIQFHNLGTAEQCIVSNFEGGGYGLHYFEQKNAFQVYTNSYYRVSANLTSLNKMYFLSGRYDGNTIYLRENDAHWTTSLIGTIKAPANNTIVAIGANPTGANANGGSYLSGKVYAVRIYNRVLTEEEVQKNYEIDKARFGIE